MKFLSVVSVIFFCFPTTAQNALQDSILQTANRVVYNSKFENFGFGFLFNKNGSIPSRKNKALLDTLVTHLKLYEGCTCELEIDDLNTFDDELNQKRIDVILKLLTQKLEASNYPVNIYWQGELEKKFDLIFGPSEERLKYIQKSIWLRINCSESFHIIGERQPFTGHYIDGYQGKIFSITPYVNGRKHGSSFHWQREDENPTIETYENDQLIHVKTN